MCRYGLDALLSATLSPRCAACACVLDTPLAGPVCGTCWNQVRILSGPFCRTCGDPLPSWRVISVALERCPRCRRRRGLVDAARAAGEYEGPLRRILHAFKYEGRRGLAGPLAAMMHTAGAAILGDADASVPVPLHPWRRVRRGFNQADDLARRLDVPMLRVLWRGRATAPQTGLNAAARRRNMRRAFRGSRRSCRTSGVVGCWRAALSSWSTTCGRLAPRSMRAPPCSRKPVRARSGR